MDSIEGSAGAILNYLATLVFLEGGSTLMQAVTLIVAVVVLTCLEDITHRRLLAGYQAHVE